MVFSILHILLKDENTFKLDSCSPFFFLIYILVSHQKIDFSVQWTSRYLYFFEKLIFFSYKLAGQINIACIYILKVYKLYVKNIFVIKISQMRKMKIQNRAE